MSEPKTILGWLVIFPRKKDCKMPCQNITNTDIDFLSRFLPENHETHVCKLQVKSETSFTATLRTRMTTEAEARQWLNDFEKKTFTTWRVNQTFPRKEKARNTFKICLHCHHNTKGRGIKNKYKTKNTSCKAILMICVKRVEQFSSNKKTRSKDVHFLDFPTRIVLRNDHNHSCEDSLPFRDVSKPTKDKLLLLLERGHNPYSMHERLLFDLKKQYSGDFDAVAKDRALCPDIHYCYRLYYDVIKKKKEEILGRNSLEKILREYNEMNGVLSAGCTYIESSTIVAICTPLMRRVNSLMRYSGELVFIDSVGDYEQFGCRLYLLLTHSNSVAGGLPVGVIIIVTQEENKSVISAGLQLLTSLLGEEGFFHRGSEGPQVFLTDDCESLRGAICEVFPNSYSILCTFRFLQAIWKWLWNGENDIEMADRHYLLQIIKEIMYAPSVNAVIETYQNYALLSPIVNRYPQFRDYLRAQVQRQHLWALAFRQHLLVRGYTTNSLSEAAFHLIGQQCLRRTKMFHFHQMIDFVIVQLEDYVQDHLLEVAEGTCVHRPIPKFPMKKIHLVPREKIKQVSDTEFVIQGVESRSNFTVDTDLEMCSCAFASRHNSCKHLFSVFHHFNIYSLTHLSYTEVIPETKQLLYRISKGKDALLPGKDHSLTNGNPKIVAGTDGNSSLESSAKLGGKRVWDLALTELIDENSPSPLEADAQQEDPQDETVLVDNPEPGNKEATTKTAKASCQIQKRIKPVANKLRKLVEELNKRMREDPDLMIPNVEHFVDTMVSFQTNDRIAQALCSVQSDPAPYAVENSSTDKSLPKEGGLHPVSSCTPHRTPREISKTLETCKRQINDSSGIFQNAKNMYIPSEDVYRPPDKISDESFKRGTNEHFRLPQEPFQVACESSEESFRVDSNQSLCMEVKRTRFEENLFHRTSVNGIQPLIVTVQPSAPPSAIHVPENNFLLEHTYSL